MADPVHAQIPAEGNVPERGEFVSAALPLIFHTLDPERVNCVLELGFPSSETFTTYQRFFKKIYIEDLARELWDQDQPESAADTYLQTITNRLIQYPSNSKFDLVVCWDILNYLTVLDLSELMNHLTRFCHRGTHLLSLISTYRSMPLLPMKFHIHDDNRVSFQRKTTQTRLSPRYSPNQLRKLFPQFKPENVTLLRCGYFELLMVME